MILRPLDLSLLRLAMSGFFKGKARYNDTLVLGDWVLVRKPLLFSKSTRYFKVAKRSFVAAYILYFLVPVK